MSVDTTAIKTFTDWYTQVKQQLVAYDNWMANYVSLHNSWYDAPKNTEIKQHLQANRLAFTCAFTGSVASGKSALINQLLHHNSEDNAVTEDVPQLDVLIDDDFPVLSNDNTQAVLSAVNLEKKTRTADNNSAMSALKLSEDVRGTMTPVLIMHDTNIPNSCFFLNNESYASNESFESLASVCHNLTATLNEHWNMILCETPDAMSQTCQLINRTKTVNISDAEAFGFDTKFLPVEDDTVAIPAWRLVIINVAHPLLTAGMSFLDMPARDSLYYRQDDSDVLLSTASMILHTFKVSNGITLNDALMLDEANGLVKTHGINVAAFVKKHATKQNPFSQQMLSLARVPKAHLYEQSGTLLNAFAAFAAAQQEKYNQDLVVPVLKQMIAQSKTLSQDVKSFEQGIEQEKASFEELKRRFVHANDDLEKYGSKISVIERVFAQTEVTSIYQHIQSLLNAESFNRYSERARSLYGKKSTVDVVENAENARNIMLSGIKLDLKRVGSSMTKMNNSMQALYQDLNDNFQNDTIDLSLLTDKVRELEQNSITAHGTAEETFTHEVLTSLQISYLEQVRKIEKWYSRHMQHLNDPLKLQKKSYQEARTLSDELKLQLTESKTTCDDYTERLNIAHLAKNALFDISTALNALKK